MAILDRNDLESQNQQQIPDNNEKSITPFRHRSVNTDIIDSMFNLTDDDAADISFNPIGTTLISTSVESAIKELANNSFTKQYIQTFNVWQNYDTLSTNHGFGEVPKFVQVVMVSKSNANGYIIGEEIHIQWTDNVRPDTGEWRGVSVTTNSNSIRIRIGLSIAIPINPDATRTFIDDSTQLGGFDIKVRAYI